MVRKLHIGGKEPAEGWEIFNAVDAPYVDHLGNAKDLSKFEDNTFDAIYGSHVLEHFDYSGELGNTLKEWNRVLKVGGKIYISVPDLDILATLFLARESLSVTERFFVMRMMFGGHVDEYDYHIVGLNFEFLTSFLSQTGFTNIKRVEDLGFFNDTSRKVFKGVAISVNIIAEKG